MCSKLSEASQNKDKKLCAYVFQNIRYARQNKNIRR